jgi:hypothetical protein
VRTHSRERGRFGAEAMRNGFVQQEPKAPARAEVNGMTYVPGPPCLISNVCLELPPWRP